MLCEASPDCVLGLHPNEAEELVGFSFFFFISFAHKSRGEDPRLLPRPRPAQTYPGPTLRLTQGQEASRATSLVPNWWRVTLRGWGAPSPWLRRKTWVCPEDLGCRTSQLCCWHLRGHRKYLSLIEGLREELEGAALSRDLG